MKEGKNCERPEGRKIREVTAWDPKLGCKGKESDTKMGLWGPVFYKNGALVSISH